MRHVKIGILALLVTVPGLAGAAVSGTWGLGVQANYEAPLFKLRNWFPSGGMRLGGTAIYVMNETWTVEVEGNWTRYKHGDLEDRTFLWSVDGQEYSSPDARSEMVWVTGSVNWVRHFDRGGARLANGGGAPYVLVGTGFFHYANKISGLIFPGQNKTPLDTGLLLRPVEDKRTSPGLNLGVGYEFFTSSSLSVDFRAQYAMVFGSVRPLEAWGLKEAFPFQQIDVGVRLKFYLVNR